MESFRATGEIKLSEIPTRVVVDDAKRKLKKLRKKLSKLQNAMYAEGKHAALICFQGMDTAGKDSLIREVFKNINARGVFVHSFKTPSKIELSHDYMWRHYIVLPAKGKIAVFNRTHYENVLVTRVHPQYIFAENNPNINSLDQLDDTFYRERMDAINQFEDHLAKNGTVILKFFLNISKDEQKHRLLRRLNLPEKNWKFSPGDLKERKLWDSYQNCYEEVLSRTSTSAAPWYIIPSDDKLTSRYFVAKIIKKAFESLEFKYPELEDAYKVHIEDYKNALENE